MRNENVKNIYLNCHFENQEVIPTLTRIPAPPSRNVTPPSLYILRPRWPSSFSPRSGSTRCVHKATFLFLWPDPPPPVLPVFRCNFGRSARLRLLEELKEMTAACVTRPLTAISLSLSWRGKSKLSQTQNSIFQQSAGGCWFD